MKWKCLHKDNELLYYFKHKKKEKYRFDDEGAVELIKSEESNVEKGLVKNESG